MKDIKPEWKSLSDWLDAPVTNKYEKAVYKTFNLPKGWRIARDAMLAASVGLIALAFTPRAVHDISKKFQFPSPVRFQELYGDNVVYWGTLADSYLDINTPPRMDIDVRGSELEVALHDADGLGDQVAIWAVPVYEDHSKKTPHFKINPGTPDSMIAVSDSAKLVKYFSKLDPGNYLIKVKYYDGKQLLTTSEKEFEIR